MSLNAIDFDKIKQKKVKLHIHQQQQRHIEDFSDFEASVGRNDDLEQYLKYERTYLVKENCDVVWDYYTYSSQTDIWDIHRVSFGMLYSKESQSITYADQFYFGIEKGQIFFLNLKVLNGLVNLPVSFKIITMEPDEKLIEFSYLKGGKASGKQVIRLQETDEGYTRILHQSYVRSDSNFRDKFLYPYFHNKIINEFHLNMRRMIAYKMKNSTNDVTQLK